MATALHSYCFWSEHTAKADTTNSKQHELVGKDTVELKDKSSPQKNFKLSARVTITGEEWKRSRYKMDYPNRGKAIIINNKTFQSHLGLKERTGTDVDEDAMDKVLGLLNFEVSIEKDRTAEQMQQLIEEVSLEDYNDSDCFCCVILSHGGEDILYGVDAPLDVKKLLEPLKGNNCPSLIGKPKIFSIQACRGQEYDHGADVTVADNAVWMNVTKKIPAEADFLIVYSVVPEISFPIMHHLILIICYRSWINFKNGSWFIQALSSVLKEYGRNGQMDLLKMLTEVNNRVAKDYEFKLLIPP